MSGEYVIESKQFSNAITKAVSIISLGEKADTNVLTIEFTKKGMSIEAKNSVASFRSELPVKVVKPAKERVSIIPEALVGYCKSYKELVLKPSSEALNVTSGKAFNAKILYIGSPDDFDMVQPEGKENISKVAKVAVDVLNVVGGIRNRTDAQPLGVIFNWGDKLLELTVGDTHHAIVVDAPIAAKGSNSITTTLPNLQKIMDVGNNFAATDDMFYAWSDTEYLSIANKTDNMFLADVARQAIKEGKKTTKAKVDTSKFRNMIDTLTGAVEESTILDLKITKGIVQGAVSTGAGSAKAAIKTEQLQGKEASVSIAVHHLRDCLSAMKEKMMFISVLNNMVAFESSSKEMKIVAAMTAVGGK